MRFGACRIVALALLLFNCTTVSGAPSMRRRAMDFCVDNYTRLTGKALAPDVDRVYVVTGDGQVEILFTRGEVGTFGKRSESYWAYLSCGLFSDPMQIYFLVEPLQDPLIDVPEVKEITEGPQFNGLRESLYLRTDQGFCFVAEQPFDPGKIEAGKPTVVE